MNRSTSVSLTPISAFLALSLMVLLLATAATVSAGGGYHAKKDIVAIAKGSGQFDTLVAALEQAGLVETLQGQGPFTVFAPTDEAFAQIPSDDLNALLADREALTAVLTYHVVPGAVTAEQVAQMRRATTVQGQAVRIRTDDGVSIDSAKVVKADIMASNGVIHVIDRVIMPKL